MSLALYMASFVAFALTLYVLLDGFDLGVGALLLLERDQRLRDRMIDSIAPTWDGNETWLVMAAVALFAGFPIAYGILLPALYVPLVVMLLALGIRGVTFEFRVQSSRFKGVWDLAFGIASLVAVLAQGAAVGTLLRGLPVQGQHFTGTVFEALTPAALLSGCALLAAYVTLGAGWLRLKQTDELREFAVRALRGANTALLILVALGVGLAAANHPEFRERLVARSLELTVLVPLLIGVAAACLRSIGGDSDLTPFVCGLLQCALLALCVWSLLFPDVVPFRVTLWSAAATDSTQRFLLAGALTVTPLILGYSAFAYRVFRGKTPAGGWES